jgi:hypothetical protein
LVFLAAEREERFVFLAAGEAGACDFGFAGGYDCDAFLVLAQFVALVFEVEYCSAGG